MIKNKIFFGLILSLVNTVLLAQSRVSSSSDQGEPYSLNSCITFALKNNITLKQTENQVETSRTNLQIAKFAKYPTLNGQYNLNGNAGRNVDPFSNSVVTQAIGTNNLGIGANLDLFDGNRNNNTITLNKLNVEAALLDIETQKNTITLQVALAYLNVLSTEDLIEVSYKQLEVTKIQLDRTQKLIKSGALAETNLFDIEAQIANDELAIINAENAHQSAKLTLKQAMNAPADLNIKVIRIDLPNPNVLNYSENPNTIYLKAIGYLPEIKAGDVRLKASERNVAIAKSLNLPTISLSSSWGTAYSSVAKKLINSGDSFQKIPVSADFQGQTIPFVINLPQQNFDRKNIPYFNQLGNNQNVNIGVLFRVPIFNGYNQKFQLQLAKIQKTQVDFQNQNAKLVIRQNIDQAFINMLNAQKRYTATATQTVSLEKSFKASESRFGAGSGNFFDYNLAKTNFDRAKANLIIA